MQNTETVLHKFSGSSPELLAAHIHNTQIDTCLFEPVEQHTLSSDLQLVVLCAGNPTKKILVQ